MSFDWRKFHTLANQLVSASNEESWRSAISRAYYAIYNILCHKAGFVTPSQKAKHQDLILIYKELQNNIDLKLPDLEDFEIQIIGNELDNLRRLRNESDYHGTKTKTAKDAKQAIEKVEAIFELLNKS
jgi:uncharacterized protein (UPF0332 family)